MLQGSGLWTIKAAGIINPGNAGQLGSFIIKAWANNTNTIVEDKTVTGPTIIAGALQDLDVITTNFGRNDILYSVQVYITNLHTKLRD